MATPEPHPETRTFPDLRATPGVTLRVDFSTGKILGPVDPEDLRISRPRCDHAPELADLPRRRPE
ncbi:MAG: hypothetical protein JHC95_18110 [Solirubrobacteraceae bacterium]|nr:hypothetical protein [Solirubrobacteraceae bacterium]